MEPWKHSVQDRLFKGEEERVVSNIFRKIDYPLGGRQLAGN
ncbi:MAG: hypothetical protein Q4B48_07365 [Syntrophomonadaceae bacterium]|nr:hypothetical protein [Syntrophomonadaceae bacterium]